MGYLGVKIKEEGKSKSKIVFLHDSLQNYYCRTRYLENIARGNLISIPICGQMKPLELTKSLNNVMSYLDKNSSLIKNLIPASEIGFLLSSYTQSF